MPNVRVTVRRGQVHKANVAEWITLLREGHDLPTLPAPGLPFVEHTGFDESVRDQIEEMAGESREMLLGYLLAMNQREEIRAK